MSRLEELEHDIDLAIRATDDPKDRAMLMLMQKILIHVEKLLSDEESLRIKVLNGDYPTHTNHHVLIHQLNKMEVVSAVEWVNKKLQQEKEASATNKGRFNKFIDSTIADLPKVILYALLTLSGLSMWIK